MSSSTNLYGRIRSAMGRIVPKRRTSTPGLAVVPGHTDIPAKPSAQARLATMHSEPIGPIDISVPPNVTADPTAVRLYQDIGCEDGRRPGADEHSGPGRPEQPSAAAVRNSSRSPLDRLGERWEQIKTAYETGRIGQVLPQGVRLFRELAKHTWHYWLILAIVLAAGVTAELVYGVRAAALLTVADPMTSLLGAIAFSLAMNGLAWYAAHMLFTSNQNVVRGSGTKIALAVAVLIGILVSILGMVVGGVDPVQMNTVDGGAAAVATTVGPHARWTLAAAYTLILTIVSTSITAGHLLILDTNADLKVTLLKDAERKAKQESLGSMQQTALVISLGEAIIEAIPSAHRVGRQYVEVYNASFRQEAPVAIAEMFLDVEYDDRDPEWLRGVRTYLDARRNIGAEQARITRIA